MRSAFDINSTNPYEILGLESLDHSLSCLSIGRTEQSIILNQALEPIPFAWVMTGGRDHRTIALKQCSENAGGRCRLDPAIDYFTP